MCKKILKIMLWIKVKIKRIILFVLYLDQSKQSKKIRSMKKLKIINY